MVFTNYLPSGKFVNNFYRMVYLMKKSTRENLLEKAELLFSQKGFNGTSIKDVAAEVNVTKQGLLHHFPTKEKLYAAVLNEASSYITEHINLLISKNTNSKQQLIEFFENLLNAEGRTHQVIVLLIRELLDNEERADKSNRWYLKPFLDQLIHVTKSSQEKGLLSDDDALALVYHLLGSTQYFLISQPTLCKLYSREKVVQLKHKQIELIRLVCNK